ncbi:MAG: hypothetical protein JWM00_391 [Candidatus Saccharibacteria bacterium]|nr:hypothetical protein [Candidatus Saccharibacteria bacterium]
MTNKDRLSDDAIASQVAIEMYRENTMDETYPVDIIVDGIRRAFELRKKIDDSDEQGEKND